MWTEVSAAMMTMAVAAGLLGCALQVPGVPENRDEIYLARAAPAERAAAPTPLAGLALTGRAP